MKLYAYCICDHVAKESLAGVRGVDGASVRTVERDGLTVFVSEPEREPVAVTPENVRAHNRVNTLVLAHITPLPFRFGTVINDAKLDDYVKTHGAALRDALARVGGCVEMGVKIMSGAGAAPPVVETADGQASEGARAQQGAGSGTAFLLAKRRAILGDEAARSRAEEVAALLASCVADAARDSRVAVLPSNVLIVRAAHLVERERLGEYRARLRALEAERAAGLSFLTSGPWPPYSFGDINST